MIRNWVRTIGMALCCGALPVTAHAGAAADALAVCLGDSTSGKDRKELARWVFSAISVHPEMQDLSALTPALRTDLDRRMAVLVTRLITEDCLPQARAAVKLEGAQGLGTGFKQLGELAMQELMNNANVKTEITAYMNYVDKAKLEAAFAGQ